MEEDFGGGYLGKGEGDFCGGLVLGGKGNGWEIFWESWEGNFDGDYLGEGEENLGGIIWGRTLLGEWLE